MNKTESIARKILGWKLNRWDRWYDYEKSVFIPTTDFQPEQELLHAMLIVERLEKFGFTFMKKGDSEVCFNDISATGETLAEAITNAAYSIVGQSSVFDSSKMWGKLC
ncbi:BC1872 family protein [Anaerobacillus isosaccharinicus]|uniref:Phage ABA sandwich domain-containing protein n=1 Tax=Anaerobacillus isosaccharinicus TaxID=1532552 RepID=A0A1S2LIH2_9BACI|nr:hypothetical protein [Anaerobacillus isosaccharinicus]MBA5586179.1 hypothetical protein [Anaerobacillus isosaccharinicus]QOY35558.1 hypothetical protein AWH56_023245 [Anaerobacillus isosaccharinicus]